MSVTELAHFLNDLVANFDPENAVDRRLFYEVTGVRIRPNEFLDDDSSDSSEGCGEQQLSQVEEVDDPLLE